MIRIKSFNINLKDVVLILIFAINWQCAYCQQRTVEGTVLNSLGEPVPYVSIVCKNSGNIASSDLYGNFSLRVNASDSITLVISHIGYDMVTKRFAQNQIDRIEIIIESNVYEVKEVVISDKRLDGISNHSTSNVMLVDAIFIGDQLRGNLLNSLEKIPGIQASNVGPTMSRPLIRGNSGYRIVIAKNSIKQEEQYWNMHQGLAVDQYSVEDVEIIKGPASLYYGSDAIGGVINIKNTNAPALQGVEGDVTLTGRTNNDWLGMNAKINGRRNSMFFKASASHHQFADYSVPADSFEYKPMHFSDLRRNLTNTAGTETSLSLQTGIVKSNVHSYLLVSYYHNQSGFFAFSAGQELMNADTAAHFASRRDILYPSVEVGNFDIQHSTKVYLGDTKINFFAGLQMNSSAEYDYIEDITGYRTEDVEKYSKNMLDLENMLATTTSGVNFEINDIGRNSFMTGVNFQHQRSRMSGFSHLLPEYRSNRVGVYTAHKYRINSNWLIQTGIRGDYCKFHITESFNPNPLLADSVFNQGMSRSYPGISYAAGAAYTNGERFTLKLHFGKSYRNPAVYELASYGIHRHNLRFEKGNPSLKPEEAYQIDLVAEFNSEKFFIAASPFFGYFTNYIYLLPTPDFSLGTFTGQVYEYRQCMSLQYGTELIISREISSSVIAACSFEFVYAMNYDTRQAMPYTPPISAIPELVYFNKKKNLRIGFEAVCVAAQNLTAINERATPAYVVYNVRGSKTFVMGKQEVSILLAIQNITDRNYLNHLSYYRRLQIPEPGRNVVVSIRFPFERPFSNSHIV